MIINTIPTSIGKILINFLGSKLIYRPADNRNRLNMSVVSVVLFLFLKYVYRNRIAMTKNINPITRVIVVNMDTLNMHKTKPDKMHRMADDMASVFVSFIKSQPFTIIILCCILILRGDERESCSFIRKWF